MNSKAPFILKGRNPDVLTSIANLSNDEVFTPPDFATRMLDTLESAWAESHGGANIWQDKTVTFIDPFTKSGVFLREIARRLIAGLEHEIPNLQKRVNHVLSSQVFGIAITELTSMLARRSVYCSKYANSVHSICSVFGDAVGNISYDRVEHSWVGGSTREIRTDLEGNHAEVLIDGRCKFCGASQSEYQRSERLETHAYAFVHTADVKNFLAGQFGEDVKFDVVIGNPPYQLSDGGHSASATPIYQLFVEQALKLEPRFLSMVIPARWYSGGKGLTSFRDQMLHDRRLSQIHDFPSTNDVFPGVNVRGGICYFLWARDFDGEPLVSTYAQGNLVSSKHRPLLEPGASTFIRSNEGVEILKRVIGKTTRSDSSVGEFPDAESFSQLVSSRKPFGLDTTVLGNDKAKKGDLRLYRNGGISWISPTEISAGHELVASWKVFVPYASPGSDTYPHLLLSRPIIAGPNDVASETYLAIGPFGSETEARSVAKYMASTFFRFMLNLQRVSQHVTKGVYRFVPIQDFTQNWTDEALAEKYGLLEQDFDYMKIYVKDVAWADDFNEDA